MAEHSHGGWVETAQAELSRAGYRRGGARRALLELLAEQPCALTVKDMEDALRADGRAVGRASVYRVLDELERLGLVQRVEVRQGRARYERMNPSHDDHHHHLVCDRCGRVVPFEDTALEEAIARLAGRVRFAVDDHEVVLRGACGECAA